MSSRFITSLPRPHAKRATEPSHPFRQPAAPLREGGTNPRAGVALIMTIGLLSLLLLLAFTFAVSMQTERAAASASLDGMRARQSVLTTLSRAACDAKSRINGQVIDKLDRDPRQIFQPYPPRDTKSYQVRNQSGKSKTLQGVWSPYGVYGKNDLESGRVDGVYESGFEFVPGPLRADAQIMSDNMWWASTFTLNDQTGYRDYACTISKTLGFMQTEPTVYAIMSMNLSGFLDPVALPASGSWNSGNRRFGTNSVEICTVGLKGGDKADESGLNPGDVPMAECAGDMLTAMGLTADADIAQCYFYPFSHFPVGQYIKRPWGHADLPAEAEDVNAVIKSYIVDSAYIGGADPLSWSDDLVIKQCFRDAFPQETPPSDQVQTELLNSLKDYIDEDYEPANYTTQPCQEPIAQLNELIFRSDYTCSKSGTNFEFVVTNMCHIEVWNPHIWDPEDGNDSGERNYRLRSRFQITELDGGQTTYANFNTTFDLGPTSFYVVARAEGPTSWTIGLPTTNFSDHSTLQVEFKNLGTLLECDWGSGFRRVDSFKSLAGGWTNVITITNEPAGSPESATTWVSVEALDPRFNYDLTLTNHFRATIVSNYAAITVSNINNWTQEYIGTTNSLADGSEDGYQPHDTWMFCANAPLRTVGELGYIAYAPWKTLRLFHHPSGGVPGSSTGGIHRVVDTFTIIDTNNEQFVKGLVNPNTEYAPVLQACFREMPVDRHPDEARSDLSTANKLLGNGNTLDNWIASEILAHTSAKRSIQDGTNQTIQAHQFFYETSDMGLVTTLFDGSDATMQTMAPSEFEKESIIRNSCGLFSTRQNLYASILVGSYVRAHHKFEAGKYAGDWQYYVNENAPRTAERRAVAVFWVDPWTSRTIVRSFKYVNP